MVHLLHDVPGAFTTFRRRHNTEYNLFDFEIFAGWAPTATPSWLADAAASLATSQPLATTSTSIPIDEVHRQMSMLWEEAMPSALRVPTTGEQNHLVDFCVMSNAAAATGPWHPYEPQTWPAARIFLARLHNDISEQHWPEERKRTWYECKAYSRLQNTIVGKSKGFQRETVHKVVRRKLSGPVWRDGPKGTKRRVFTAPTSFIVPSICRFLRAEQLKRQERRRRREGGVNDVQVLPVNSEDKEKSWFIERTPIDHWPAEYEYV
ncbi:hypothetical protein MBLNU13_g00786t1 [Cladosporium sp. NU13]